MCWNATVSMNTFLAVVFAAIVGIFNNSLSVSQTAFFLSYGGMQLVEYFLWRFPALNSTFSAAGLSLIVSQPLFSILTTQTHLIPLLSGYLGFLLYSVYIALNPTRFNMSFSSTVASNGHLRWNWLPSDPIFLFLYMILLFAPMYISSNFTGLIGGLLILLISLITYGSSKTWGSMWCWFAALYAFIILGRSAIRAGTC